MQQYHFKKKEKKRYNNNNNNNNNMSRKKELLYPLVFDIIVASKIINTYDQYFKFFNNKKNKDNIMNLDFLFELIDDLKDYTIIQFDKLMEKEIRSNNIFQCFMTSCSKIMIMNLNYYEKLNIIDKNILEKIINNSYKSYKKIDLYKSTTFSKFKFLKLEKIFKFNTNNNNNESINSKRISEINIIFFILIIKRTDNYLSKIDLINELTKSDKLHIDNEHEENNLLLLLEFLFMRFLVLIFEGHDVKIEGFTESQILVESSSSLLVNNEEEKFEVTNKFIFCFGYIIIKLLNYVKVLMGLVNKTTIKNLDNNIKQKSNGIINFLRNNLYEPNVNSLYIDKESLYMEIFLKNFVKLFEISDHLSNDLLNDSDEYIQILNDNLIKIGLFNNFILDNKIECLFQYIKCLNKFKKLKEILENKKKFKKIKKIDQLFLNILYCFYVDNKLDGDSNYTIYYASRLRSFGISDILSLKNNTENNNNSIIFLVGVSCFIIEDKNIIIKCDNLLEAILYCKFKKIKNPMDINLIINKLKTSL